MKADALKAFILAHTQPQTLPFLPELKLYQAQEHEALWREVGVLLGEGDETPFPFWAFAWPGGQALARYVLDRPETVAGLRVLDFAAGGGVIGLAASRAGAKAVGAADIDPLAQAVLPLNAALNGAKIKPFEGIYWQKPVTKFDVILAGDVCYEHTMSHRVLRWLRLCAEKGVRVLLADPGRAYAPTGGLKELARYTVPTSRELEERDHREVTIWQLVAE